VAQLFLSDHCRPNLLELDLSFQTLKHCLYTNPFTGKVLQTVFQTLQLFTGGVQQLLELYSTPFGKCHRFDVQLRR